MDYLEVPKATEEPLASVLNTLGLERLDTGLYRGMNLRQRTSRIYGGQVIAQATMAAADSLAGVESADGGTRMVHSITGAFLNPGQVDRPITVSVQQVNDGRSFSTRRVQVHQGGKTIFSARASFQVPQPGVEHQSPAPQAPDPETLASSVDLFRAIAHPAAKIMSTTNAVDIRHVEGNIYFKPALDHQPRQLLWMRTRSPMPRTATQLHHRALLAYAADQFMLEPIMRMHGICWVTPDSALATLDHTVWWHRDVDVSQWILVELESPSAQGGRGLTIAKFWQEGRHIATMSQEGMVRVRHLPSA